VAAWVRSRFWQIIGATVTVLAIGLTVVATAQSDAVVAVSRCPPRDVGCLLIRSVAFVLVIAVCVFLVVLVVARALDWFRFVGAGLGKARNKGVVLPRLPIPGSGSEQRRLLLTIDRKVTERGRSLVKAGVLLDRAVEKNERYVYRFLANGKLIYFFSMRVLGPEYGSAAIGFQYGWIEAAHRDAMTAWGRIYRTLANSEPVVGITNFSFFVTENGVPWIGGSELGFESLSEYIWQRASREIESRMPRAR
jgi:hypothetical protein